MKKTIILSLFATLIVCSICLLTACDFFGENQKEDIEYTLSEDGSYYIVSKVTKVDNGNLVIPSVYKDLPVKEISYNAIERHGPIAVELTSVTIPDSIIKIDMGVFSRQDSLTEIYLGGGELSIGEDAFACRNLEKVNYMGTIEEWVSIDFANPCANPLFLGEYLYIDGVEVTQINIDAETIKDYAFCGYENLTSVTFGSNVKTIGAHAFEECDNLTEVAVPDNITTVGEDAFCACEGLTTVSLGSGLTKISDGMFYGCKMLSDFTISDTITTIGMSAFGYCAFENLIIPEGIVSIENGAFAHCGSLTTVTIPSSVTKIGRSAFDKDCAWLNKIIYTGTIDQWVEIQFEDEYSNPISKIDGYYSLRSLYINDTLVTNVNLTTATKVNDYAFYSYPLLKSVTISSSVTEIGDYVFHRCRELESVVIEKSVTKIGTWAFETGVENIQYKGTVADWNLITKESEWMFISYNEDYKITCTDGIVSKDGVVTGI